MCPWKLCINRRMVLPKLSIEMSMLGLLFHDPVLPYSDKRKQVTITQIWDSYIFRLDLAYYSHSEFGSRNAHPAERYLSQDIMILYWCQCTWQTHFAHLWEMSFSRVASFLSECGSVVQLQFVILNVVSLFESYSFTLLDVSSPNCNIHVCLDTCTCSWYVSVNSVKNKRPNKFTVMILSFSNSLIISKGHLWNFEFHIHLKNYLW